MTDTDSSKKPCRVLAHGFCNGKCPTCKPHEVAEVLALLEETDPAVIKLCLTDLGYASVLKNLPEKASTVEPFYCAIVQTKIVTPCLLRSCPFWVDRNVSHNCLLCYYKTREGNEELTTRDIAEVLDYTVTETNSLLESGLTALRHMAIGLPIGIQDLQESFEFLPTTDVCCVCEKSTPDELSEILTIPELGLAYCSLVCRIRKNPAIINLEHSFHADIADILSWTLANFVKVSAMEQALNMDSYAIQQIIRQFLGVDALKAYPGEKLPEAIQPFDTLFSWNSLV